LKNAGVLSVVIPLLFPVFRPPTSLCKVYWKEVLSTVENDQIQDQIRELDKYKSADLAEGSNCPL